MLLLIEGLNGHANSIVFEWSVLLTDALFPSPNASWKSTD